MREDMKSTKRRLLGELKDQAREWKRDALRKKYAPAETEAEEEAEESLDAPRGETAELAEAAASEAAPEGNDDLAEAKAALENLSPEALQELLASLKK